MIRLSWIEKKKNSSSIIKLYMDCRRQSLNDFLFRIHWYLARQLLDDTAICIPSNIVIITVEETDISILGQ